ncbi:MAG: glycosyltransferase family 4 protein [Candidatus Omnitrophota bacterium]
MKVIYILHVFPKISETFILNEILEVQRKGITVEVFAFARTKENKVHDSFKEVQSVNYFSNWRFFAKISAHFYWLFKHPLRYMKVIFIALNMKNGIFKVFLWDLDNVLLVSKRSPEHIHAHFGTRAADLSMLINLLTNIPFTFTTHRYDVFDSPPKNYRLKSKLAKKHITISQFNERYLIDRFNVNKNDIEIIHCGVNCYDKVQRNKNNFPVITCVARLEKTKGLDNLIKACNILKREGVVFSCNIVGNGSERARLAMQIKDYGLLNEVNLLGDKTQKEVFDLMSSSSMIVLPSRSEGIPVSLMEAMALRIPVISTKINGIPELIENEKNGFLVSVDDVKDLTEKIKKLIENKQLREIFVENGYKKVKDKFNLEKETDKLIKIWES